MFDSFDEKKPAHGRNSRAKSLRVVFLAVLLQISWPRRLTSQEIIAQLPFYGDGKRPRALYRDIETLTGHQVVDLPQPDEETLAAWCIEQREQERLAISYDHQSGTFGLEQPVFSSIELDEDEARAFVALQEGFTPGAPYAQAVQALLTRWAWLFSPRSRQLVAQKRKRLARPILLPLSPVEDYSKHEEVLLQIDQALESGIYLSFAYTPLGWDAAPIQHTRIEPYELEYRDGHWYFTAYVSERNDFVDYRVDRIRPASVILADSENHFLPGNRRRRGVKIRYWVSPSMARYGSLSARLSEQHVTLLDDNQGAIVEGYAKSIWWARRLLLGYGAQVKALEPEELVQTMRREVEMMGQLYQPEER
jgi:predicted DNA-binding transcriptional regulator YafY